MKPQSKRKIKKRAEKFLAMKSIDDLAALTSTPKYKLVLKAGFPQYVTFTRPKRSGGTRLIETPVKRLKKIQRTLNNFLQSVYYFIRTDAAYGFLINAKKDKTPRNIITNAQQHLDQQWLLNVDMKDFFHWVKTEMVYEIFVNQPFDFKEDLADILARLTTYLGRLPMGAPTSPVLSNFATIPLDNELLDFAKAKKWKFTRYADDMSFSADEIIPDEAVNEIRAIVEAHRFKLNENKVKKFGPGDEKLVTGLRLDDEVELSSAYTKKIKEEIIRLQHVMEARAMAGKPQSKWVDKYISQVEGMMNFAELVLGDNDEVFLELDDMFEKAINPPDKFSAVNWLDFHYF